MTNAIYGWDMTIKAAGFEPEDIIEWADEHFKKWTFQKEQGEITNYIHYQFRGSLKVKMRQKQIEKLTREAGFETIPRPTCGKVFETDDHYYAKKDFTRIDGPWSSDDYRGYVPVDMRFTPEWNPLQKTIIERMAERPNRRTINCIVDPKGHNGKSFLATWMFTHGKAVYIPYFTEAKDLMRMIHGLPKWGTYFIDLPRALSHKAENEIYGGIEQLKTGIIYDDRYRFRMEAIDPVHVFVFTNRMPNMSLCSSDRWSILTIPGFSARPPAGVDETNEQATSLLVLENPGTTGTKVEEDHIVDFDLLEKLETT